MQLVLAEKFDVKPCMILVFNLMMILICLPFWTVGAVCIYMYIIKEERKVVVTSVTWRAPVSTKHCVVTYSANYTILLLVVNNINYGFCVRHTEINKSAKLIDWVNNTYLELLTIDWSHDPVAVLCVCWCLSFFFGVSPLSTDQRCRYRQNLLFLASVIL